MIRAECHSDDYQVRINFDATAWFEQANAKSIVALAECDWGGDYPADAVANHFSETTTSELFTYIGLKQKYAGPKDDSVGFECHVNALDAAAWLKEHKPEVLTAIPVGS